MKWSASLFAQTTLFLIYSWFGLLKLMQVSPATSMVQHLFVVFFPAGLFSAFFILFALFEIVLGFLFLFYKTKPLVITLFAFHLFVVSLPLLILPGTTWQGFLVPTMEGQYIIKNLALAALVGMLWERGKTEKGIKKIRE